MKTRRPTVLLLTALTISLATRPAWATDQIGPGASRVAWPLPTGEAHDVAYAALAKRHGFTLPAGYADQIRVKSQPKKSDGSPAHPAYELYVPPDLVKSERRPGVLVWISAGNSGKPPRRDWLTVLDRHSLVWVGPDDVGNDADTLWRTYMATEAVRHARGHFDVDPGRVYVAGVSGGGRIASHAALVAPDTFTGGFYVVGCDFWRDVPVTPGDRHGKHYRGFWRKPDGDLLRRARKNRYVLLTGGHDFNRENTKAVYDGYRKDNYAHVALFDIPGFGHTVPNAEWFEKGLAFLDKPAGAPRPPAGTTRPTTRPKPTGKIIVGPR